MDNMLITLVHFFFIILVTRLTLFENKENELLARKIRTIQI